MRDAHLMDKLKAAIELGDLATLEAILSADASMANVGIPWEFGGQTNVSRPLHYVSDAPFHRLGTGRNQTAVVDLLVRFGASLQDARPSTSDTPLHTAVSLGQIEVVRALLDAGADPEAQAEYVPDGTALGYAVEFGEDEIADLLYDRGAAAFNLTLAAGVGDLSKVKSFFTATGDLLPGSVAPAAGGPTPASLSEPQRQAILRRAIRSGAMNGRLQVLGHLLSLPGVTGNDFIDGLSFLHWAALSGRLPVVQFLIEQGADPAALDQTGVGSNPASWVRHRLRTEAIRTHEGHREVLDWLTAHGHGPACGNGGQS